MEKIVFKFNREMVRHSKYIIFAFLILFGIGTYAQTQTAKSGKGLIALAFDDTKFKRAFHVYELESLNSETGKWQTKNDWSLQCKGYFKAPVSGEVSFFVESDYYIRVEIGGSIVLEDNENKNYNSFKLEVKKGKDYPIDVYYIHDGGESFMKFSWSWKDKEKVEIPGSVLFYQPADREELDIIWDQVSALNKEIFLTVLNPDPENLPGIDVWEKKNETMVGISFPNVPGLICDAWCYESELELMDIIALDGGRVKLIHEYINHPFLNLITLVSPEPGAVEFSAWIEKDKNSKESLPVDIGPPNLCWQLKRAENFNREPKPYPEFVKRCFMLTSDGQTQLNETDRKNIPVRKADEEVNNPPWVQNYFREDQPAPVYNPNSWAGNSDTRYSQSIIGAISKDGKYLTAIANNSSTTMCQAWHDCMHNNPQWLPANAPVDQRIWRLKIYGMENNSDDLLSKIRADFPEDEKMTPEKVKRIKSKATYGSAYQTMGVFNHLDYPVIASMACPKPMLFYNGKLDKLFPVSSVNDAYDKMQDEAFIWLNNMLGKQ